MTILESLAAIYDRLDRRGREEGRAIVPPPGQKPVEIDYLLEIDLEGRPVGLKKQHVPEGRRRAEKLMMPGTAYNPKPEKGDSHWENLSFGGRTSGPRTRRLPAFYLEIARHDGAHESARWRQARIACKHCCRALDTYAGPWMAASAALVVPGARRCQR